MLIQLSAFTLQSDRIERRDELFFARNDDCRLALLELDRLCPVAHRKPDWSKHVLTPPRTHPLSQLDKLLLNTPSYRTAQVRSASRTR